MPSSPIWTDPRYARFFQRAEQTIARARELQVQPWLGRQEERLHRMIEEICGTEPESLAIAS